ncbi:MAG: hypothetical protein O7C98_10840 [Planctomycetota bacterium]|nr:hypothetical protein [Planctomycetota bacterium]
MPRTPWIRTWTGAVLIALPATLNAQEGTAGARDPMTVAQVPSGNTKGAPGRGKVKVVKARGSDEEIKVLKPTDIPLEMKGLRGKADIKAEIQIRTVAGRPVVFPGVIRNGKLMELLLDGKFETRDGLEDALVGVRLWWGGDSDGYIFFRYNIIKTITLMGEFTAEERRALFKRLAAKRASDANKGTDGPKDPGVDIEKKLEGMTPGAREAYLVAHYPYDKGWNHERYRELTRKRILEDQQLSTEEDIFLKFFMSVLGPARFEELSTQKKIELEPGSEPSGESPAKTPSGRRPGGSG